MLQNQKVFILFVGIVFLAVLLFFLFKLPEQKKFRIVHVLLAVIVAGGIGNMIDRFRLDYVVDFISFVLINYPIGYLCGSGYHWPVYSVFVRIQGKGSGIPQL